MALYVMDMKGRNKIPKRISEKFQGVGEFSDADVERRAKEIAIINERENEEPNESDWKQAVDELTQPNHEMGANDEQLTIQSDSNMAPDTMEIREMNLSPYSEETQLSQTLVEEGVEEAEHDTSLAAHKNKEHQGES